MNKIKALAKVLSCEPDEITIKKITNAWFSLDIFTDYEDRCFIVLDDQEHYYNGDMYGIENMQEIGKEEFYIYEVI